MRSDSFSHRRGLAYAVVLGVGIVGFHHSALARVSDQAGRLLGLEPAAAARWLAGDALLGQAGAQPGDTVMVADKKRHGDKDDDDNGNAHRDGQGNRSGNGNDGNGGNWNKSGHNGNDGNGGNWNKSGHNGNGNDGNWNENGNSAYWNKNGNNGNWNKSGNYGNWNKGGNKHWSDNNHWNNNWNKNWNNRAYVRGWSRRPYYGEFFGGVVLGSLLAAAGAGVVPYSPDPELCWYWADPYMYRGYWDYCY